MRIKKDNTWKFRLIPTECKECFGVFWLENMRETFYNPHIYGFFGSVYTCKECWGYKESIKYSMQNSPPCKIEEDK